MSVPRSRRLSKELGLFDVYAICTGAMFSSGFFLLPGLAAAQTGPSVALAYLVAGLFILPAMLSVAELATAMPRAGGAYYFLDRSLGPLVGTIGGLGSWFALIFKSAFALVGLGAYLAIYFDIPIEPLAIALTAGFTAINIIGAKETSGLQRVLVGVLLLILSMFLVQGLFEVVSTDVVTLTRERFTPFMPFGLAGFMGTVGFVFVSYAGLTKVASVSEEVRDPDRNIPLGMALSLATATVVYTVGVFILVSVLPPDELRNDLTPVATAAAAFFDWLPGGVGVGLIVVAAIAAFASTGNAGIMSASRYPLAMARDRLVSPRFETLGRFRTPTFSIVVTGLIMAAVILLFDVAGIAKIASAFQLILFSLLNLAVIIMRESRIEAYDPGFRSPFYPWMQIFGMLAPVWLITEMGQMAILLTLGLIALTAGWYFHYARQRVVRAGAIFHAFERLGALRHGGLDLELRSIVREKGLRADDPFDEVVARATVIDVDGPIDFATLSRRAAVALAAGVPATAERLEAGFIAGMAAGVVPVAHAAALPHLRIEGLRGPLMLIARCQGGLDAGEACGSVDLDVLRTVRAVFFLVSASEHPAIHLRLLGHVATQVDDPTFLDRWIVARDEAELKATLLSDERWLTLRVGETPLTLDWVDRPLRSLALPEGCLMALIRRDGSSVVPGGSTILRAGDHVTIIGDPEAIGALSQARSQPRVLATTAGEGPDA